MEKELNIAAILKEKPKNTKLWTCIYGDVYLDGVNNIEGIKLGHHGVKAFLLLSGKAFEDGEVCIFPSKEMRSWEKFAWKKGDVLANTENNCLIIFDHFDNSKYTSFCGKYAYDADKVKWFETISFVKTEKFQKADIDTTKSHILDIEVHWKGKLNLETLQIEQPKQEFKDGDIVVVKGETKDSNSIGIVMNAGNGLNYHYWANYFYRTDVLRVAESYDAYVVGHSCDEEVRMANNSEKQKLFNALAKENKAWDTEKKVIVDLPKKCGFKQMDLCLMSDGYDESLWNLCQFAFKDGDGYYHSIGGGIWRECIPYNDSTKHLLGTTDEWKGGEG